MSPFIDLSHAIHDGLVTYPGLPAPKLGEYLDRATSRERYASGTEFSIGRIELVANTGTYLDDDGFRFFAVPVKVRGMGSFPVRAFALLES